jgi:hypothetical protein
VTLIVVPWRDDGHRSAACQAVCEHLRGILPGCPLLLVDSGHEIFNRAASRNLGVTHEAPDEIVVICDADTLPEAQSLKNAITRAYDGRLHYPFAVVNYLTEIGTATVLAGQPPDPTQIEFSIPSAQGGVMVMKASAWRAAGGMPEGFIGWGFEDNAWYATVAKTIGPPIHHAGVAWHLWHPHDRYAGTIEQTRNFLMARRAIDGVTQA